MSADVDSGSPPADGSVTWRFTDRTRTSTFGGYLSTDQLRFDGTVSGIDAGPNVASYDGTGGWTDNLGNTVPAFSNFPIS